MRRLILPLSFAVLALVGVVAAGCETKSADVRHEYPSVDADRVRPGSDIPQLGTDGFVDED